MRPGRLAASRLALSSLRVRLVLLVLLAVLPSLILILHRASEQRRAAITQVKQDALRVARLASANHEQFAEGARQLLIVLTHLPALQGNEPEAANSTLRSLLPKYSLYSNFGVIESDGTVFASALAAPAGVNLSDRAYFRRAVEGGDFAVGDYQIGRITGQPSVNFGFPMFDKAGKVYRVAFAAMELSWIEKLASGAELRPHATLTVLDAHGVILAGWPRPEEKRGRMVIDGDIKHLITERHQGIVEIPGADGTPRIVALAPLEEAGQGGLVTVAVSVPKEKVVKESMDLLMRNLAWLGLVIALAVAAAWYGGNCFILCPVQAMLKVTRRVHEGDLAARTGVAHDPGELGQLAQAIDEMTASLQQRGAERDRAQAELQKLNSELESRVEERTLELYLKNEQLRADLELAREFQVGLLPHRSPILLETSGETPRTLRLAHRFEPSGDVGGDFFEVLPLSDTEAGIFVSDVMGHGVKAALLAALIRGLVEQLKPVAHDPARFMHDVNEALVGILHTTGDTMFASAVYVVIDVRGNVLRYVCAGHSRPLHLHRKTGHVEPLKFPGGRPGPVLGLFANAVYSASEASIEPGDGLLIYTDGVFEVSDPSDEEFGEKRLREAIQRRVFLPLDKIFTEVVDEIQEFSASSTFEDDVCMVGVEVELK